MPRRRAVLPRRPPSLPYALAYAALFATIGLYLPYFPVWLESRGFTAEQIGLVIALPAWLRIVTTPLLAGLADRSGRVIGINTAVASSGGTIQASNIGFAISIDHALGIVDQLLAGSA